MKHTLTDQTEIRVISTGVTAGNGDTLTLTEIDLQANGQIYNNVLIVVALGVMAANATAALSAKLSDTTGTYGAGTIDDVVLAAERPLATGAADQNKLMQLEIVRPRRRFVSPRLIRAGGANTTVLAAVAILWNGDRPTPTVAAQVAGVRRILNNPVPSQT